MFVRHVPRGLALLVLSGTAGAAPLAEASGPTGFVTSEYFDTLVGGYVFGGGGFVQPDPSPLIEQIGTEGGILDQRLRIELDVVAKVTVVSAPGGYDCVFEIRENAVAEILSPQITEATAGGGIGAPAYVAIKADRDYTLSAPTPQIIEEVGDTASPASPSVVPSPFWPDRPDQTRLRAGDWYVAEIAIGAGAQATTANPFDEQRVLSRVTTRLTEACFTDINGDGILDNGDISAFIEAFLRGSDDVDFNNDGILDNGDILRFVGRFIRGC